MKHAPLLFRAAILLFGLFCVGYINGVLKGSVTDVLRLVIAFGLIYAVYCASGAFQNALFGERGKP
jgi:hypothetical protein